MLPHLGPHYSSHPLPLTSEKVILCVLHYSLEKTTQTDKKHWSNKPSAKPPLRALLWICHICGIPVTYFLDTSSFFVSLLDRDRMKTKINNSCAASNYLSFLFVLCAAPFWTHLMPNSEQRNTDTRAQSDLSNKKINKINRMLSHSKDFIRIHQIAQLNGMTVPYTL